MKIRTVTYDQLSEQETIAWSEILLAEPSLSSPYFRPEFTEAVSAVRNDVEIAVLEDGGRPIGFLPFQRSRRNVGQPIGGKLSDFHGLIASANVACDPLELLRSCGLTAWHFDHLMSGQQVFAPFVWRESDSPYVDLADSFDAYVACRDNGRRIMAEYGQKKRKLIREVGPVRYESHVVDPGIISTFFAWKSDHFRRMNVPNIFEYSWVRDLVDRLLEFDSDDFRPVLSVLYAGDVIAAIDFGMRSRSVLHPWFPTYNIELARYSPGNLYWIETMQAAVSMGIRRIDFGKGSEPYKLRLMSGVDKVLEGTVDLRHSAALARRAWWSARDCIRTTPLAVPARMPMQVVRRMRHWLAVK